MMHTADLEQTWKAYFTTQHTEQHCHINTLTILIILYTTFSVLSFHCVNDWNNNKHIRDLMNHQNQLVIQCQWTVLGTLTSSSSLTTLLWALFSACSRISIWRRWSSLVERRVSASNSIRSISFILALPEKQTEKTDRFPFAFSFLSQRTEM